jgi:hypothetical protein
MRMHLYTFILPKYGRAASTLMLLIVLIGSSILFQCRTAYAQVNTPHTPSGTIFPPPIFYQLRDIPSYVIIVCSIIILDTSDSASAAQQIMA